MLVGRIDPNRLSGPAEAHLQRRRLYEIADLARDEVVDVRRRGDPAERFHGAASLRLHRTLSVLSAIAELGERGFGPSNREVAERAGIRELEADPPQMSRLLWCLESLELIENTTHGQLRGGPNAWRVTAKGEQLRRAKWVR